MRIAVVGSGNVATHLTLGLRRAGHTICAVYSRTFENARQLADKVSAPALESPDALASLNPDVILVSVADSCVRELVGTIPQMPAAVALHTSGTVPQEVLAPITPNYGILYPLQTFSKDVDVCLSDVPFFIEGATDAAVSRARELASALSPKVHYADAAHRKVLHIAGVLSCNFPNFLWECCERILAGAGYPLEVVEPLVRVTVDKAFSVGPHAAQTGPARRRDMAVIKAHAAALPPELAAIYEAMSAEIIKSHYE